MSDLPLKSKKSRITDFFYKKIKDTSSLPYIGYNAPHIYKERKLQTFLDFGQRNLAAITCNVCGMVYDRSFAEDIGRHEKEHERMSQAFKTTRYETIAKWKEIERNGDKILIIDGGKFPKANELCNRVNCLIGAFEQRIEEIRNLSIYLYSRKDQIVAFLSVENIRRGLKISQDGSECEQKVEVGVSRIWTNLEYRRMGIAMTLLNSIRKCSHQSSIQCSASCKVPPNLIAFSQPTADGKALAMKFFQDFANSYIIYRDIK